MLKGQLHFGGLGFFIPLLIDSYYFLPFYIHFLTINTLVFNPPSEYKSDLEHHPKNWQLFAE